MALPNFIIAGAAKSGTTSLYHYLVQHPDICMSSVKEPKFFIDFEREVDSLEGYEALFSHCAGEKARGEATTWYLYDRDVPSRLKDTIPGIKIIIILRNPVEMAFAQWRHTSRLGRRGERLSFPDALKAEPGRMADPEFNSRRDTWPPSFYYFNRGLYHDQVKRYMDTFGRENVLVVLFEDFKKDPAPVCREIFKFLGVDENFLPRFEKHNVGVEVSHRGLDKLLMQPPSWLSAVSSVIPGRLSDAVRNWLQRLNRRPAPVLDSGLRAELLDRYAPDIKKLEELLGRDLSVWI